MLEAYKLEAAQAVRELLAEAKLKKGEILVVGCSSSEITAHKIGSFSNAEIGNAVFEGIFQVTKTHGIYLAAQCCEHLNRSLIVEQEMADASTAWSVSMWYRSRRRADPLRLPPTRDLRARWPWRLYGPMRGLISVIR